MKIDYALLLLEPSGFTGGPCILVCTKFQLTRYIQKQSQYKPSRFQEDPRFQDNRHEGGKDVSPTQPPPLSPPQEISAIHFRWRMNRPLGHSETGRIMSMKNSSETIENRTRDLPACSAVPQPTPPPHTMPYSMCLN